MLTNTLRLGLFALTLSLGCSSNPVGRICDLGGSSGTADRVVATPSLDCLSRECLRVPQEVAQLPEGSRIPPANEGLCTAQCDSDDDCDRVPESPCVTGFTCAVAVLAGDLCCKKYCICKDYIVIPEGGIQTPQACNPADPKAHCCNLEGRRGNAMYPQCKL